jgi:hypothetical protein
MSGARGPSRPISAARSTRRGSPQHFLYLWPLSQGQGAFPTDFRGSGLSGLRWAQEPDGKRRLGTARRRSVIFAAIQGGTFV